MFHPLVASALLAAAMASADAAPPPRADHPFAAAARVARDPATGQITAPEYTDAPLTIAAMQDLARLEAAGLVTIRNADGSETLNHEGRFSDFSVIRLSRDGRRVFQCAHGRAGLEHVLHAPAPIAPITEDR